MLRRFLKSKIRDIRLTGTYLDYEGSITLDEIPGHEPMVLCVNPEEKR